MRHRLFSIICSVVLTGLSSYSCSAADPRRDGKENAERAAGILAANPEFQHKARIPTIKVLKIVDDDTVYVRTNMAILSLFHGDTHVEDRIYIDGATGEFKKDPNARRPDELALNVGEGFYLQGDEARRLILLKVEKGRAFFQHSGFHRNMESFSEFISVLPYEDGFWKVDPKDKGRLTYTEYDEQGKKRLEQNYKDNELNGLSITWYKNGQKESECHFKNNRANGLWTEWYSTGQKRYQATFKDGRAVGKAISWLPNGKIESISEHTK